MPMNALYFPNESEYVSPYNSFFTAGVVAEKYGLQLSAVLNNTFACNTPKARIWATLAPLLRSIRTEIFGSARKLLTAYSTQKSCFRSFRGRMRLISKYFKWGLTRHNNGVAIRACDLETNISAE